MSTHTHGNSGRYRAFFTYTFSNRCNLLILIGVNLLTRGLWLSYMHPPQFFDFQWYYTHAIQLSHGEGYRAGHHYTAYWPIGYPFFLSLLFRLMGSSLWVGWIANVLLSTGIVLLVYFTTLKLTSHSKISFASALGYTMLPSQIEWNSVLGSEELFTFLLVLSLYIYLWTDGRRWWASTFISGLVLGLACDVRPIPLLFPAFLLGYEVFVQKRPWLPSVKKIILFCLAVGFGVCPVTIRNWMALHHWVLISTNGGINLWQGTHSDGAYFWSWDRKVNPILAAGSDEILANQIGVHAFIEHALHHPFATIVHGLFKWFFLYWLDSNVVAVTFDVGTQAMMHRLAGFMASFNTAVYWLWMGVCMFGVASGIKRTVRSWRVIALPMTYVMYNTAVFFFFPAWDRFRYPMMPFFAVLFGIGWTSLMVRLRIHRKQHRAVDIMDSATP